MAFDLQTPWKSRMLFNKISSMMAQAILHCSHLNCHTTHTNCEPGCLRIDTQYWKPYPLSALMFNMGLTRPDESDCRTQWYWWKFIVRTFTPRDQWEEFYKNPRWIDQNVHRGAKVVPCYSCFRTYPTTFEKWCLYFDGDGTREKTPRWAYIQLAEEHKRNPQWTKLLLVSTSTSVPRVTRTMV